MMDHRGEMAGKVALITGASSGIGWATAVRFAAEGAMVAMVARHADRLGEAVADIEDRGGKAKATVADLGTDSDVQRTVSETVAAFGGIDVLVNAAGCIAMGSIENMSLEDWDRLMNVNVRSLVLLIKQALPYLIARKGSVVNVSSVAGIRSYPGLLAYCCSKVAVDQLTHCVALDLAPKGVRVNAVNPGVVATNLHRSGGMSEEDYAAFLERGKSTHPLGRIGTPDEVAELILFLASERAAWITGVSYPIDGGRSQTCLL